MSNKRRKYTVPDEGYFPETRSMHLIRYLRLYYYHWVDTSTGRLLVPDGIIRPVVSASTLTWCIRYIYYCLHFLNKVIIIKTKIILLQA